MVLILWICGQTCLNMHLIGCSFCGSGNRSTAMVVGIWQDTRIFGACIFKRADLESGCVIIWVWFSDVILFLLYFSTVMRKLDAESIVCFFPTVFKYARSGGFNNRWSHESSGIPKKKKHITEVNGKTSHSQFIDIFLDQDETVHVHKLLKFQWFLDGLDRVKYDCFSFDSVSAITTLPTPVAWLVLDLTQ